MTYTVTIDDAYTVPAGALAKEQYVEFVLQMASESYAKQYGKATKEEGIQAACDAYNASVLEPSE